MIRKFFFSTVTAVRAECRRTLLAGTSNDMIGSMKELRSELSKHVGILKSSAAATKKAVNVSELEPRSTRDSYDRVVVPLGKNKEMKLKYLNPMGHIRFGRILADLDTFAVWLSYRHNQGQKSHGNPPMHHPMVIVTACVDQIDLKADEIQCDKDIAFEGVISYVGTSSMEATIHVSQQQEPNLWDPVLEAKFLMVARNPATLRSVPVYPLVPNTTEEKSLFEQGKLNMENMKQQARISLLKTCPTVEETTLQHELFLKTIDENAHTFRTRVLPAGSVWMQDCKLKNLTICFPEQTNLYNKVFGGFLMRSAFELAWANACVFSSSHPKILAVDDIMFRKSVEIGSLLYLSSEVCYTEANMMQIRVHAEVVDVMKGTQQTTNTFHFTFASGDGSSVASVLPKSYADGMLYLSGKRHFDEAKKRRH